MNDIPKRPRLPSEDAVEAAIHAGIANNGSATISPADPARALVPEGDWQAALPVIRRVAIRLARQGAIGIYRKGKPVDPNDFRGVYRLGPPGGLPLDATDPDETDQD